MRLRSRLSSHRSALLLSSLVALAGSAGAQSTLQPATPVGSTPAHAAPAPKVDGREVKIGAEAGKILDRAAAAYHALKTYQDFTDVEARMVIKGAGDKSQHFVWQEHSAFAYAGPRLFTLRADAGAVYGHDQTFINQLRSRDENGKPTEEKELTKLSPDGPVDWADCMGTLASVMHPTPVHGVLMTGPGAVLDLFLEADEVTPGELDERPGVWVKGKGVCPYTYGGQDGGKDIVPISAWFSSKSGLLREIRYDFSRTWMARSAAQRSGEDATIDAVFTVHINNAVVNAPLDEKLFVYSPNAPRGARFEMYSMPAAGMGSKEGNSAPSMKPATAGAPGMTPAAPAGETISSSETLRAKILDQPAPAFTAKTPDGASISLADFKGKVVLIDVWATWCGPCMQAIPAVQRVSEHFKDQPVAVIGVNRDKPSDDVNAKVKKVLDRKGITFYQAMDQDGSIAKSYKVTAIPAMFIIDKTGVIRAVHVGSGPGEQEMLTGEIEKLLKGEALSTNAQDMAK